MTPLEAHFDFKIKSDAVQALSNRSYTAQEIDWLLKTAQLDYIRRALSKLPPNYLEKDTQSMEDISTLHIRNEEHILTNTDGVYTLDTSELNNKMMLPTRIRVRKLGCDIWYGVPFRQSSDIDRWQDSPFESKPIATLGKGEPSSIFIYSKFPVDNIKIDYIKEPSNPYLGTYTYIDGTTPTPTPLELPSHIHQRVVDLAVEQAQRIVGSPITNATSNYIQLNQ